MNDESDGMPVDAPLALEWAGRELDRVWGASDAADNKILLSAGTLASIFTALLVAASLRTEQVVGLALPFQWCSLSGFFLVIVGLIAMLWLLRPARYSGAFDPQQIVDEPRYLQSNEAFSRQAITAIAQAFRDSREGNRKKLSGFRWALLATILGIALFALAPLGAIYEEGVRMRNQPSDTPAQTQDKPTPAPTSNPVEPAKPLKPLTPYVVERGTGPGRGGQPLRKA